MPTLHPGLMMRNHHKHHHQQQLKSNHSSAANETDSLLHHPLHEMERRARRRKWLNIALAIFFLSLLLAMAIWYAKEKRRGTMSPNDDDSRSSQAAQAIQKLNDFYNKEHEKKKHHELPSDCETTILIFRHCEKLGPLVTDADGNEHCSYLGHQRAAFLPTLFTGATAKWPAPVRLFAYTADRGSNHWNFREYETLRPLSEQLDLSIHMIKPDHQHHYQMLLKHIARGDYCGQTVVYSWRHEAIPELAASLGCGPNQGCPTDYADDEFDRVWQIKYVLLQQDDLAVVEDEPETDDLENTDDAHDKKGLENGESAGGESPSVPLTDEDVASDHPTQHDRSLRRSTDRRTKGSRHQQSKIAAGMQSSPQGWYVYGNVVQQHFDPLAFAWSQQGKYGKDRHVDAEAATAPATSNILQDESMDDEI